MNSIFAKLGSYFKSRKLKLTSDVICAVVIGIIIAVNVIVYALTVSGNLFLYSHETVDLTLSGATDRLFAKHIEKNKKVTITFCQSEENVDNYVLKTARELKDRYPDFIELKFVNVKIDDLSRYQEINEETGEAEPIFKTSVIFECENNFKVLTDLSVEGYSSFYTVDSSGSALAYHGEEIMASMIGWVLKEEHLTAYFTTHHGEVADVGLANMLMAAGYNIDIIDLRKNEVPENAGMVVISNPVKDFERAMEGSSVRSEIERLRTYMERGGQIFVALDPYIEKLTVLESFIAEYGIEISSYDNGEKILRNIVRDSVNAITADSFTLVADYADTNTAKNVSALVNQHTDSGIIVRECAQILVSGDAEEVLVSSSSSSTYAGSVKTDSKGGYCVGAVGYKQNEETGRGKIFVTSGIYLTATDALVSEVYANRTFIYALLDEVFETDGIAYGCKTVSFTTETLENLTMGMARVYTVFIALIPVAIAALGAVIVIKRKNR